MSFYIMAKPYLDMVTDYVYLPWINVYQPSRKKIIVQPVMSSKKALWQILFSAKNITKTSDDVALNWVKLVHELILRTTRW